MKPPPAEKSIIPSIPPLCPSENLKKSAIPKNRQKKIQFEFLSPPVSNIDFRPLSPLPLSQQPQINMFYKRSFPHQELITIIPLLQPQIAPTNRFPTSPAPNRLSPPPVPSSPPSFNQYSSNFKYLKKKITILHSLFPPKKDIWNDPSHPIGWMNSQRTAPTPRALFFNRVVIHLCKNLNLYKIEWISLRLCGEATQKGNSGTGFIVLVRLIFIVSCIGSVNEMIIPL